MKNNENVRCVKYNSIITDKRLVDYVARAFGLLDECKIKYSDKIYSITVNKRLRTSWGICKKRNINNEQLFVIELNQFLLDGNENAIMDTLLHELLHTCYNSFNHGKNWQRYAAKLNERYGFNIKRTENYSGKEIEPQKLFKYFVRCKRCGNLIGKTRLCKVITNPERYRCAKCKGALERV